MKLQYCEILYNCFLSKRELQQEEVLKENCNRRNLTLVSTTPTSSLNTDKKNTADIGDITTEAAVSINNNDKVVPDSKGANIDYSSVKDSQHEQQNDRSNNREYRTSRSFFDIVKDILKALINKLFIKT